MRRLWLAVALMMALPACTDSILPGGLDKVEPPTAPDIPTPRVHTDKTYVRDEYGRYVYLSGINVGGTNKLPVTPAPDEDPRGTPITFVGRPFPIEEAPDWFRKIKYEWGFNSIRLVVLWEAIEHEGFRQYDEEYLQYIEDLVAEADKIGLYVLINFHENLFSRFLYTNFNRDPEVGQEGSIEYMLSSLFPKSTDMSFDSRVTGDGAPRWAVEACLPEKDIDSPHWGMNKMLGQLGDDFWFFQIMGFVQTILDSELVGGLAGATEDPLAPPPEEPEPDEPAIEDYVVEMVGLMKNADPALSPFEPFESCDVLPLTGWWENTLLSYDVERCYAAFYNGDETFPSYQFEMDGRMVSVKEYLQEAYKGSWLEVTKRVKKYPNVIGYDLVNEPPGGYLALAAAALYFNTEFDLGAVEGLLAGLVGEELGSAVYRLLFSIGLIPVVPPRDYFNREYAGKNLTKVNAFKADNPELCSPVTYSDDDIPTMCTTPKKLEEYKCLEKICEAWSTWKWWDNTKPEGEQYQDFWTIKRADLDKCQAEMCWFDEFYAAFIDKVKTDWNIDDINLGGALNLNLNFTWLLVQLYDLVGTAIQNEDPNAIIWLEEGGGALDSIGGALGSVNLWKPEGIKQMIFTPHWYPDIYPYLGFNEPPRYFEVEEWLVQDFTDDIASKLDAVTETFGPVPTVFGEFGTYFNYNNWDWSVENDYVISANILDNYYEAYEKLFLPQLLWCFSADNEWRKGDLWNFEDFSIYGEDNKGNMRLRGERAWARPKPFVMSGKPIEMHFYSDYHYYDPDKGEPDPWREFYLAFGSKETDMPTEIFIPKIQYPNGFYVWLSDGWAIFDRERSTLFFYPTKDDPNWNHTVTVRPPQDGRETTGFTYFFDWNGHTVQGDHH